MFKKKYKQHKIIINNFFWRGLQIFGKQGITLVTFFMAAKLLSKNDFGIYNYIIAAIYFFVMFGDFGISSSVSKSVAEYRYKDNNRVDKIIYNSFLVISVLTGVCIFFLVIFGKIIFKEYVQYIYYTIPLIFLIPANSLLDGIYRGYEKFKILSFKTSIVGLFSVGLILFLTKNFGLIGALLSLVLFNFLLFVILIVGIKKPRTSYDKKIIKEITSYSLIIGLGSVGFYLYTKIDLIFLGYYGFMEEISIYEIINKLQVIFLTPFLIMAQVISPRITRLYADNKVKEILMKLKMVVVFCLFSGLFICLSVFFLKEELLSVFLSEYSTKEMYNMLNLMLLVYFTQIVTSVIPVGFTIPTGHARISMNILLFFGLLNVILNYIFINIFGFIGVIYSTMICKISADILFLFFYIRKIRIKK